MAETELSLIQIKHTLDRLSEEVPQGKYPSAILKVLKLSVDQLRLTLWAIIAYRGQGTQDARGADFGLQAKLVEFRIKRLLQMLSDLCENLENGDITPSNLELPPLCSALQSTLERVNRVMEKAG